MPRAFDQVALVKIVWPHADADEVLHQLPLDMGAVIHSREQHRLVSERDARARKAVARLGEFTRNFVGMIDVNIHPQRMVLAQGIAKLLVNSHWQKDRHAGANPNDLNVRTCAQACEDFLEQLWPESRTSRTCGVLAK
jgi:hypothetical protein